MREDIWYRGRLEEKVPVGGATVPKDIFYEERIKDEERDVGTGKEEGRGPVVVNTVSFQCVSHPPLPRTRRVKTAVSHPPCFCASPFQEPPQHFVIRAGSNGSSGDEEVSGLLLRRHSSKNSSNAAGGPHGNGGGASHSGSGSGAAAGTSSSSSNGRSSSVRSSCGCHRSTPTPVQFCTSPPLDVYRPRQSQSPPPKLFHMSGGSAAAAAVNGGGAPSEHAASLRMGTGAYGIYCAADELVQVRKRFPGL